MTYTSSPTPAMATPSAATTASPFGRNWRSSGCTIKNLTPSRPLYLSVATSVPITLARIMCLPTGLAARADAEARVGQQILIHFVMQLRYDGMLHQLLAARNRVHSTFDSGTDIRDLAPKKDKGFS